MSDIVAALVTHLVLMLEDNERLVVTGTGLSPQVSRSPSPSFSSVSDSGTAMSEDYTVLDGVREMNEMLLKQIQAIRQQIDISEKEYEDEKAKLVASKNLQLQQKDKEISNLRSSMHVKDENLVQLKKVGAEKDKVIQNKSVEIENLKNLLGEIQDKAHKIQKKVKRAQRKTQVRPTDNTQDSPQNEETLMLTTEMGQLKTRLVTLEGELAKAVKLIEKQTDQMRIMGEDKKQVEAKLTEELNKVSESMRKEVERACQVLLANNEEMQQLKQQNVAIFQELSSVKSHLQVLVQRGDIRTPDITENLTEDNACENQFNNEQASARPRENLSAMPLGPASTPRLQRENSKLFIPSNRRKTTEVRTSYNERLPRPVTQAPGSHRITRPVTQSEDFTRHVGRTHNYTLPSRLSVQTLAPPVGVNLNSRSVIPPIGQKSNQGKPLSSSKGGVRRDPKN